MLSFIAGVFVGAIASYLVLRNNAKTKAKLDALADKGEAQIKDRLNK